MRPWRTLGIAASFALLLLLGWGALLQADLLAAPAIVLVLVTWFAIAGAHLLRSLMLRLGPALVRSARTRWDSLSERRDGGSEERGARRTGPGVPIWLAKRLGRGPRGLPLTAALCLFVLCAASVFLLGQRVTDPTSEIARFDLRISNLAAAPDSQAQRPVMSALTEVGRARVMGPVMAVIFVAAVLAGARTAALVMVSIPLVTSVTVTMLKSFHARPRPGFGQLLEASASFPSGHSAGGLAFAAGVIAMARLSGLKRLWLLSAVVLPFGMLIGYSRAYLSVHWTSDVVGGWLVAGAVASLLTAVALMLRRTSRPAVDHHKVAIGLVAAAVIATATGVSGAEVEFPEFPEVVEEPAASISQVIEEMPASSETLLGRQHEPVNLVIATRTGRLPQTFESIGFEPGSRLSPSSWMRQVLRLDAAAPIAGPTFLDTRPPDLLGTVPSKGRQVVVRAWRLPVVIGDTCEVWAATVVGADTERTIDPRIDPYRDRLVSALASSGGFVEQERTQIGEGEKTARSRFKTDGMAAVVAETPCEELPE